MKVPNVGKSARIVGLACLLVWLGGCAAPQRAVTFSPHAAVAQKAPEREHTLENMSAEELLSKGDGYLEQGNLALAKLHFLKALTLVPENPALYTRLGGLFLQEHNLEKARTAFAEALKHAPENVAALFGLGKCERLAKNAAAAETYLSRALQAAPDSVDIATELAICFDGLGRSAEAAELYRRITQLRPQSSSAFNNLGFHYLLQGDYAQAVAALQTARKQRPRDPLVKNNLAAAYILTGEEKRGLALFEDSLGQAAAFNNAGYIRMLQHAWPQAEAAFLQALKLNPRYYVKAAKNLNHLRTLLAREGEGRELLPEKVITR